MITVYRSFRGLRLIAAKMIFNLFAVTEKKHQQQNHKKILHNFSWKFSWNNFSCRALIRRKFSLAANRSSVATHTVVRLWREIKMEKAMLDREVGRMNIQMRITCVTLRPSLLDDTEKFNMENYFSFNDALRGLGWVCGSSAIICLIPIQTFFKIALMMISLISCNLILIHEFHCIEKTT